ncbi:hypothetical protein FE257_001785, partial [Aspergillus nanangensis]
MADEVPTGRTSSRGLPPSSPTMPMTTATTTATAVTSSTTTIASSPSINIIVSPSTSTIASSANFPPLSAPGCPPLPVSGHEGGFVQPSSYLRPRGLSHPMPPSQPERAIDREERQGL